MTEAHTPRVGSGKPSRHGRKGRYVADGDNAILVSWWRVNAQGPQSEDGPRPSVGVGKLLVQFGRRQLPWRTQGPHP